jgi:hypothetical protein
MRCLIMAIICGSISIAVGCKGATHPYKTAPISGKIAYEDGSLIKAARIELVFWPQAEPLDTKTFPRRAVASVDPADGTFSEASTWADGDGTILGKAKVTVNTYNDKGETAAVLPDVYSDPGETPLEVEVSKSQGMAPNELTVKKREPSKG